MCALRIKYLFLKRKSAHSHRRFRDSLDSIFLFTFLTHLFLSVYPLCEEKKQLYSFGLEPYLASWAGIATRYGLDGPGIESRLGRLYPHCPNCPWGPLKLPCSGYRFFFLGIKRPGRAVDHPSSSVAGLYLYSRCGPSEPFLG